MGLFGKKKNNVNATDEVFKQFGQETNDIKKPASRKEGKMQAQAAQTAQIKKDQLLDGLATLRKKMYQRPEFDDYTTKLEDAIHKLREMDDSDNLRALSSVDNFILNSLREAVNYCNRGNYIGMGACIDIIEGLIDDRYLCGSYYADPQFCKLKIRRNQLYVEQQNQQSAYDKLAARMAKLQADASNPALHVSRESIAREAMRIKEEGQRIKSLLDKIEANIQLLDKGINEVMSHSIAHSADAAFDITDEISGIMEIKRENEMDDTTVGKLNEKMDESHRTISSSALDVNENAFSEDSFELSDDIFKM